jgi:cell division protein FtsL
MTIIHTYNKHIFKNKIVARRRNYSLITLTRSVLLDGNVKITLLLSILVLSVFGLWLYIFCSKLSLDYRISVLKSEIKKEEEIINSLHESLASNISDAKIKSWAKDNGFVPITSVRYLKLDTQNLAQADLRNIK